MDTSLPFGGGVCVEEGKDEAWGDGSPDWRQRRAWGWERGGSGTWTG